MSTDPLPVRDARSGWSAATFVRAAALGLLALLPLICWPGLAHPFSTPKLWTLVAATIVFAPFAWMARAARTNAPLAVQDYWVPVLWLTSWTWSAWLGEIVSLEALLLAFSAGLLAIVLIELAPDPDYVARAHAAGATGVAIVALLQWAGADPFAWAGWIAPIDGASARLRVYGTLGNPNFVAALMAAAMPLTFSQTFSQTFGHVDSRDTQPRPTRKAGAPREAATSPASASLRPIFVVALLLQFAALAATGSRAGALGLLAGALAWLVCSVRARRWRFALAGGVAAIIVAAGLILFSTARPLGDTLAGRLYIWRAVWPHAFDAPFAGQGPGAFELRYPAWERAARERAADPAAAAVFSGPQQHAHNDYLEALVDRGLAGPVTILIVFATCVRRGWRRQDDGAPVPPAMRGAAGALAALGAIACVDFPLARPTETMLWWSAVALLHPWHPRE